jgi:hypothetical protein
LLESYARLTRELGRLPAWSDVQLRAYNDHEFPCDSVFIRRFKSKEELVRQLVDHCRGKGGYEDVIRLCDAYVPRRTKVLLEEPSAGEVMVQGKIGFVYLVKSGRFHKIGRSNSAGRREYELGIQLPDPVTTIHVIRTDDPVGIEAYLVCPHFVVQAL